MAADLGTVVVAGVDDLLAERERLRAFVVKCAEGSPHWRRSEMRSEAQSLLSGGGRTPGQVDVPSDPRPADGFQGLAVHAAFVERHGRSRRLECGLDFVKAMPADWSDE